MGKKRKRKFIETTDPIPSDDMVRTDSEGVEHKPHEGEWVKFRKSVPWRSVHISAGIPNEEYCPLVIKILKRQIVDWNWTDEFGDLLPSPKDDPEGFEDCLWDLEADERNYLMGRLMSAPAELPNGQNSP